MHITPILHYVCVCKTRRTTFPNAVCDSNILFLKNVKNMTMY